MGCLWDWIRNLVIRIALNSIRVVGNPIILFDKGFNFIYLIGHSLWVLNEVVAWFLVPRSQLGLVLFHKLLRLIPLLRRRRPLRLLRNRLVVKLNSLLGLRRLRSFLIRFGMRLLSLPVYRLSMQNKRIAFFKLELLLPFWLRTVEEECFFDFEEGVERRLPHH